MPPITPGELATLAGTSEKTVENASSRIMETTLQGIEDDEERVLWTLALETNKNVDTTSHTITHSNAALHEFISTTFALPDEGTLIIEFPEGRSLTIKFIEEHTSSPP